MERIIIISHIICRIMDIFLTTMVVVIFPSLFTTGDDKRSLFNIVGDCRTTQEPLNLSMLCHSGLHLWLNPHCTGTSVSTVRQRLIFSFRNYCTVSKDKTKSSSWSSWRCVATLNEIQHPQFNSRLLYTAHY